MNWTVEAKYHYPGPIFYKTDLILLEQKYPYYRIMGQGFVKTRVNGVGTCLSWIHLYSYGLCGIHTLELKKHWADNRAQGKKARAWCEYILKYPPLYYNDKWDSSYETVNGICRQQIALAREEPVKVTR
jgi:hypothetical protein